MLTRMLAWTIIINFQHQQKRLRINDYSLCIDTKLLQHVVQEAWKTHKTSQCEYLPFQCPQNDWSKCRFFGMVNMKNWKFYILWGSNNYTIKCRFIVYSATITWNLYAKCEKLPVWQPWGWLILFNQIQISCAQW